MGALPLPEKQYGTWPEYFEEILSNPTIGAMLMQTHAIMNRDLSLIILGVVSSLGQIGCVVLPYTRLTRASVSPSGVRTPPGPSSQANL